MIPGTEPCDNCYGNGWHGAHQARCWRCKGTGIQLCQFCQRHAAEYTTKSVYGMPQGDPGRIRWACGACVGHVKPFEELVKVAGFPTEEERKAQVATMDRATGLIIHRKAELEEGQWMWETGLTDEQETELEALQREFPLPDYRSFVKTLAELGCKGMQQQPYPCENLPGYEERLWCISCHARKLVKQEEAVTV